MKIKKTLASVAISSSSAGRAAWSVIGKSLAVIALATASMTAVQAQAADLNIGVNVGGPGYGGPPPPPPPRRWHRRHHWHRPPPPPPRRWHRGPPPPPPGPGWHR